jgi:hypothetical protein
MDDTGYSMLPPNRAFQRTARKREHNMKYDQKLPQFNFERYTRQVVSITPRRPGAAADERDEQG